MGMDGLHDLQMCDDVRDEDEEVFGQRLVSGARNFSFGQYIDPAYITAQHHFGPDDWTPHAGGPQYAAAPHISGQAWVPDYTNDHTHSDSVQGSGFELDSSFYDAWTESGSEPVLAGISSDRDGMLQNRSSHAVTHSDVSLTPFGLTNDAYSIENGAQQSYVGHGFTMPTYPVVQVSDADYPTVIVPRIIPNMTQSGQGSRYHQSIMIPGSEVQPWSGHTGLNDLTIVPADCHGPQTLSLRCATPITLRSDYHLAVPRYHVSETSSRQSTASSQSSQGTDATTRPGTTSSKTSSLTIIPHVQNAAAGTSHRIDMSETRICKTWPQSDGQVVQGMEMRHGKPYPQRKNKYSQEKRESVAQSRAHGTCLTCKKNKKQCDLHNKSPYEQCSNCETRDRRIGLRGLRLPCYNFYLSTGEFYRQRPSDRSPLRFSREEVYQLIPLPAPSQGRDTHKIRTLQLSQLDGEDSRRLEVYVTLFEPRLGDKLVAIERNDKGAEYTMPMPHYCLTEINRIEKNFWHYLRDTKLLYLQEACLQSEISRITFHAARAHAAEHPGSVTDLALQLWIACRLIEQRWRIVGRDRLDIPAATDRESPWYGITPMTPMMNAQLDQVVIRRILNPLKGRILATLAERFKQIQPDHYIDIYLAIYVLVNHVEWSSRHGRSFAKHFSTGARQRFSNNTLVKAQFHMCKMLLSGFDYLNDKHSPLQIDWDRPEEHKFANVTQRHIKLMKKTQELAKAQECEFTRLRDNHAYEEEGYWIEKMMRGDWSRTVEDIKEKGTPR